MKKPLSSRLPLYDSPQTFVDRDRKIALLEKSYRLAEQGNGQAVLVSGEPGIGKTCLVGKFVQTLMLDKIVRDYYIRR